MTPLQQFNAHLDVCSRCRENPFDLCVEGLRRLNAVKNSLYAALLPDPPAPAPQEEP